MERSPADLPLDRTKALEIADDLLTAFEHLVENPLATESGSPEWTRSPSPPLCSMTGTYRCTNTRCTNLWRSPYSNITTTCSI